MHLLVKGQSRGYGFSRIKPRATGRVILLANGVSGAKRDDAAFAAALNEVCTDLARQVVADGEGITVLAEINVTGAVGSPANAVAVL